MNTQKYRIFEQDVGETGYSGLEDIMARNLPEAFEIAKRLYPGIKVIALPHHSKHHWPDGKTGELPAETRRSLAQLMQVKE